MTGGSTVKVELGMTGDTTVIPSVPLGRMVLFPDGKG